MTGRLIAVVGPSGVGKDSVMAAIAAAVPWIAIARRCITRAPGLGGEDYRAVSEAEFAAMRAAGAFCLHWSAHGLEYGIPRETLHAVQAGGTVMANLSRGILSQALAVFPRVTVLNLTARPDTLARRLSARGREAPAAIRLRLERARFDLPPGIGAHDLANDGDLQDTLAQALAILEQERA